MPDARLSRVATLQNFLFSRTDIVAVKAPWRAPQPVYGGDALPGLLAGHVDRAAPACPVTLAGGKRNGEVLQAGRWRVGSYVPAPDGTTPWLCLDVDGGDHASRVADPDMTARELVDSIEAEGCPCYLERSGGGAGWHVWIFLTAGTLAADARAWAKRVLPLDGLELFPKCDTIEADGLGTMVWLPWCDRATSPANRFHDPATLQPLDPQPASFDVFTLPAWHEPPHDWLPPPSATSPMWREWRQQALAALALESVYGAHLTGRDRGNGWLECRDPASSSGDRHPSAAVADGTGRAERGAFHSFLTGETISIFDFLSRRDGGDFKAAVAQISELAGVELPKPDLQAVASALEAEHKRPVIQANNRSLDRMVDQAWDAVLEENARGLRVFVRGSSLVRRTDEGIEEYGVAGTFGMLARVATWLRVREGLKPPLLCSPPRDAVEVMHRFPDPRLPRLEAVVSAPIYSRDGELICTPGYHETARLWYADTGLAVERPVSPSKLAVEAARGLLYELLCDFPFASDSDRAHALALLVAPFVRRLFGLTPLHLLEAPTPASGKSLLASLAGILVTGKVPPTTTAGRDEESMCKKITSILMRAPPLVVLDNLKTGLDSAQMSAMLTAETWTDRVLGASRMIELRNDAVWVATANNPRLSMEIARRSVRIRIDAKTDRPWERSGFRHDPIQEWVLAKRRDLVEAVLTLVEAWLAAGRPAGQETLGGFETWSRVVGGILGVAGVPGFLENREELYELADAESQEWRAMCAAWWQEFNGRWKAAKDLWRWALDHDQLLEVLGDKGERSQQTRLAKALQSKRDCQFGNYRIEVGRDAHRKAQQYRLVVVEPTGERVSQVPETVPDGPDYDVAPDRDLWPE